MDVSAYSSVLQSPKSVYCCLDRGFWNYTILRLF